MHVVTAKTLFIYCIYTFLLLERSLNSEEEKTTLTEYSDKIDSKCRVTFTRFLTCYCNNTVFSRVNVRRQGYLFTHISALVQIYVFTDTFLHAQLRFIECTLTTIYLFSNNKLMLYQYCWFVQENCYNHHHHIVVCLNCRSKCRTQM